MTPMIDSHCHLDAEKYQPQWREVLDRAEAHGCIIWWRPLCTWTRPRFC